MENVENLILEHLRAIRADVTSVKEDVREIKNRLANIEQGHANLMQHSAHQSSVAAQQHLAYDRIIDRIEKIERRLELQG